MEEVVWSLLQAARVAGVAVALAEMGVGLRPSGAPGAEVEEVLVVIEVEEAAADQALVVEDQVLGERTEVQLL